MHLSEINEQLIEEALLLEANVLNTAELYDDVSIQAFLKQYAQAIGNQDMAKTFVKKIQKMLINDDRWLHAVREVPDNAPDWAKDAHAKRDLVYFKPDQNLTDKISHISHYLAAVVSDAKTGGTDVAGEPRNDGNIKAHAQRELQGFPKIGDLETIVKKSDEYFARGSQATDANTEGMTEVADVGNGNRWYLLTTNDAYRREGKTLQNCIGSHWTLAKAKNQGYSIVVMRKANNESVVAARIKNESNEIDEMKGKNNRPPIDKYMGGVLKFIRKRKLKVGRGAQYDFKRAGYFHIDGELYSRAEAMKKFVKTEEIDTVGDKQLVGIGFVPGIDEIVGGAYPAFEKALRGSGAQKSHTIYELRDGTGHATLSVLVNSDKEVVAVNRAKRQITESLLRESTAAKSDEAKALFKKLFDLKLIKEIGGEVQQDMFWGERVQFDRQGNIVPVEHEKVQHHKGGHNWEHYTDPQTAKTIKSAAAGDGGYHTPAAYKDGKNKGDPHSVYMTQREHSSGEAKNIIAVRTKSGKLIPGGLEKGYSGMQPMNIVGMSDGHHGGAGQRDRKTVDSMVSLANKENLELPRAFKHHHGIVGKKGKYEVHKPTAKDLGDGTLYDLSKIKDDEDRMIALRNIVTDNNIRGNHQGEDRDHWDVHEHDVNHDGHGNYNNPHKIRDESHNGDDKMTPATGYRKEGVPDAVYLVDVTYGGDKKHKILLQVHDKIITELDGATMKHEFQHWDDFDKVADQVNAFAEKHGLTFMRKNLAGAARSKELRVDKGKMTTGTRLQNERHGRMIARGDAGLEGTDELPLESGVKVVRLTPDQNAEWLRQDLKINSTPGEGWKVVKSNGDVESAFFVKKGEIQSIFSGRGWRQQAGDEKKMPTNRGIGDGDTIKHIKAAAKAFDWKVKPTLHNVIHKGMGDQTWRLRNVIDSGSTGTQDGSSVDKVMKKLEKRGYVTHTQRGRRNVWTATDAGKRYNKKVRDAGDNSGHWDGTTEHPLKKDYVVPDKKEKPVPPPRVTTGGGTSTAQPRTGTKAAQALALFQQLATDNDRIPTRAEFMALMREPPYSMGNAGASTYYANTKKKYAALNETYSGLAAIQLMYESIDFLEDILTDEWFKEMAL
jgi:DNA-binding MarR family transcriptional regulator